MTDNQRIREVFNYLRENKYVRNQQDFTERIGSDKSTISQILRDIMSIPNHLFGKIANAFPFISEEWMRTGEGDMLKTPIIAQNFEEKSDTSTSVLLLPVSAQGGSLKEFFVSIKEADCERMVSPINGADFAIQVSGDSMSPEYPNGSRVLIKRINERAFIEWGKAYVLDTCNGIIIKILVPSEREDYVKCLSINQDPVYAPFEVCLQDVYGIYKVLLCMSMK